MGSDTETGRRLQRRHKDTKTLRLALCLCVFVSSTNKPSAVQSSQVPQDWPQFRGNARLTGVAPADVPAALALKWTYEGGESFESSPAIAEGVVYAGAGNGDL